MKLPALHPSTVKEIRGSSYPEPFKSRMGERVKKRLGEACGLTKFGVNLVTLGPGGQSALRHWHTLDDEFVYVLSGEVWLVTDAGEEPLRAGDCAGFKAGVRDGHHLVNRSSNDAVVLEVGTRDARDFGEYSDIDMVFKPNRYSGGGGFARKDGTPY